MTARSSADDRLTAQYERVRILLQHCAVWRLNASLQPRLGQEAQEAAMLRATQALILVICLVSQAHAESATPAQGWDQATATVSKIPVPKPAEAIPIQEPYCEFGAGACGGACNEESGKRWDCPKNALPCYQPGQHCTCEVASMCHPKKKK